MTKWKYYPKKVQGFDAFGFEFYDYYYYCGKCQRWILKESAQKDKHGRLICPICKRRLRLKPRHPRVH